MGHVTAHNLILSDLPARFWAKTRIEDRGHETPCVIWTASTDHKGYGKFYLDGRHRIAHRVAYEALIGPVRDGLVIDHLCRVRECVAVDHLEPVTNRENLLRGDTLAAQQIERTHCPAGHPYDADNTKVRRGSRECRACDRNRHTLTREQVNP